MVKRKEVVTGKTLVAGRSIDSWCDEWKIVLDGFKSNQPKLTGKRGLFAAKRGNTFMYVGVANNSGAGLNGALARARVPNISGDKGFGMAMVRENRDSLEAYIIDVSQPTHGAEIVSELGKAMKAFLDPLWNQKEERVAAARQASYERLHANPRKLRPTLEAE